MRCSHLTWRGPLRVSPGTWIASGPSCASSGAPSRSGVGYRERGVGAIGAKHVGLALRNQFAIDVAAGGRGWRLRPAGQLPRLGRELLERTATALLLDALEHAPRVVTRWVGLRRRGAHRHGRIEQPLDQRGGRDVDARPHQRARRVACESRDGAGAADA